MRLFTKLRAEEIKTIVYPLMAASADPTVDPTVEDDTVADEPKAEMIIITTLHGDSHELPKADLALSPGVTERKDAAGNPTGPIVGDWLVQDYDIQTDKRISKVYDAKTFQRYFKASLGG